MVAESAPAQALRACVQQALDQARQQGATAAAASLERGEGLTVSVRLGELETVEREQDQGLSITAYFGQRRGTASSTDLREDSIARTVEAACQIARSTEEDPCNGLPDEERLAFEYPELELHHPWDLDSDEATRLALECEDAARTDSRIVNSEGAEVRRYDGVRVLGNSLGFMGAYRRSSHDLSCCVVASDGNEAQERDYWHSTHCDWRKIQDPETVGRIAAERTVRRLGARSLSSCVAPVLFEATVARSLLGHFVGAASGRALYHEASFLLGRKDEQVWAEDIRLIERPREVGGVASAPFDAEGVETQERVVVDGGVLRGWFLGSYSARRLGLTSTGNAGGVRNLSLETQTPALSWEELLQRLGRGLVVTELMGQGVNQVTGDYSRGAAGFWVEDGAVAHPVHEITIAGSLPDMYRGIVAVGAEQDCRGSLQTGALLVDRMQIAGV